MDDLTLYDIMSQDMEIDVSILATNTEIEGKAHSKFLKNHVVLQVSDENDVLVYQQISHMYAWESLVYFAKQVLRYDKKIQEEVALKEVDDEYYAGFKK